MHLDLPFASPPSAAQPMCADYGFRSGAGRLYQEHYGETPKGVLDLVGQSVGVGQCIHDGQDRPSSWCSGCGIVSGFGAILNPLVE